jgi:hypothetical protein
MNEQECENVFQQIVATLRHSQFSNLVERVMEQITEGKIVEDKVATFKEIFDDARSMLPFTGIYHRNMKSSSKLSFATVVPYTARERLEILIDVLEQSLITPIEIEAYLSNVFMERYSFQDMAFVSPEGEILRKISRDDKTILRREISAKQLQDVLARLRKEL